MDKVLILAREELVAALLGLLVESRGFEPKFIAQGDSVEETLRRERPHAVVIDCDHPDCREELLEAIRKADALPVIFSPFRMQAELRALASRHGIRSFTLPTDPDTFGRMLET